MEWLVLIVIENVSWGSMQLYNNTSMLIRYLFQFICHSLAENISLLQLKCNEYNKLKIRSNILTCKKQ